MTEEERLVKFSELCKKIKSRLETTGIPLKVEYEKPKYMWLVYPHYKEDNEHFHFELCADGKEVLRQDSNQHKNPESKILLNHHKDFCYIEIHMEQIKNPGEIINLFNRKNAIGYELLKNAILSDEKQTHLYIRAKGEAFYISYDDNTVDAILAELMKLERTFGEELKKIF